MRTLFHNPEVNQINYLDNRYYTIDFKMYYPSVTTILEVFPKGHGFNEWLKQVGSNAQEIVNKAAEVGSKIHEATERLHNGIPICWADENGNALYNLREWQMLLKYQDAWNKLTPKLIANEMSMCSEKLRYGGTLDRVVRFADKLWLIDVKTSNYLHDTHELQVAAYAMMWNEFNPENPIEETAILWLNAATRTSKIDIEKNIFQGEGWQLKTFKDHYTEAFECFRHVHAIWDRVNPNYKPLNLTYPDTIQL